MPVTGFANEKTKSLNSRDIIDSPLVRYTQISFINYSVIHFTFRSKLLARQINGGDFQHNNNGNIHNQQGFTGLGKKLKGEILSCQQTLLLAQIKIADFNS
jgi:hypothetical protein